MSQPLMPHATASWLVDNTALSFEQIAAFCGLHILEVQAIADDTAATKLTGRDPVRAGAGHDDVVVVVDAVAGPREQLDRRPAGLDQPLEHAPEEIDAGKGELHGRVSLKGLRRHGWGDPGGGRSTSPPRAIPNPSRTEWERA